LNILLTKSESYGILCEVEGDMIMYYIDLAKELITRYGTLIERIFHESLEICHQKVDLDGIDHKSRTRSNFVWDTIIHKLRSELANDSNFYFSDRYGTTFISYKQTFLIRLKKLGKNRRPSYIKTKQAEKFQTQLDLGLGDYVNVYLNYSLDRFGIFVDSIKLQCENGNSILWSFLIDGSLDIIKPDPLFPDFQQVDKRVRVKTTQKQEDQNGKTV
jgi:hypothetical protein